MKRRIIQLLMVFSLMVLVNNEKQVVFAEENEETESAPSKENEEIVDTVPTNRLVVSDKLLIEPEKLYVGEQVSFSLNLPAETTFETIVLSYLSSKTDAEVDVFLTYNSETQLYEGQIETEIGTEIGIWQFTKAVGIDENKVSSLLETTLLTEADVELKQGDFEVIPHPISLLDLPSIKVEPKALKVGEKLQFNMKSVENQVLTDITVSYRSIPVDEEKTHQQLMLSLTYNEEKKGYEGEFAAIIPDLVGKWEIDSIRATDSKGNPFRLYNRLVIEREKQKLQEQLDELNKQRIEEQTAEETEDPDLQEKMDALEEKIQQLEDLIEAKEKLLQADLSVGDFTIEESLAEEDPDTIDEDLPVKNEEESASEPESSSLLTEPIPTVSKKEETVKQDEEQKMEDTISDKSESTSVVEESAQTVEETSSSAQPADEKKEVAEVSKGALLVVVAAFIIINGFIFKF